MQIHHVDAVTDRSETSVLDLLFQLPIRWHNYATSTSYFLRPDTQNCRLAGVAATSLQCQIKLRNFIKKQGSAMRISTGRASSVSTVKLASVAKQFTFQKVRDAGQFTLTQGPVRHGEAA